MEDYPEDDRELFESVGSDDFLQFSFNERSYIDQIESAITRTGKHCSISCRIRKLNGIRVMWMEHAFGFIGGSLGCAEGEKLASGFERAGRLGIPAVVVSRSGGARMQEGTLSLMQMAKVSVAVESFKGKRLPYFSVCLDPTYGGTTASYAMQGDITIAAESARIGFAGENVILNTVYKMDQAAYDRDCPQGFQSAPFVQKHGQVDVLVNESEIDGVIEKYLRILLQKAVFRLVPNYQPSSPPANYFPDYVRSRLAHRVQVQDVIANVFTDFAELQGDGRVGWDRCIRGGLALLNDHAVVVLGTFKGHEPDAMREANFGMPTPAGYRMASRLMKLAEHFGCPVITLVDTPGAYPSFFSEAEGQPEAIASSLLTMASLTVPIVTIFIGEGGSGGALGIGMGDRIAVLSDSYYGVITPEGAASILCRYKDEKDKALRFLDDCRSVATKQKIYPTDLLKLGVIDEIIWEDPNDTFKSCDGTLRKINDFLMASMGVLYELDSEKLVSQRYNKFRSMGQFVRVSGDRLFSPTPSSPALNPTPRLEVAQKSAGPPAPRAEKPLANEVFQVLNYVADTIVNGQYSILWNPLPNDVTSTQLEFLTSKVPQRLRENTAKYVLDNAGPDAVVSWIRNQKRVLITDTTMRDAHQSLLATRVRTADLLSAAEAHAEHLADAFSMEVWGGATFDVCVRFLHESPWKRLQLLRKRIPNICFQMLLRGSNAVGYKSYPDNVIEEFVRLAAKNGIDVFRIFDCFNDLEQMRLPIKVVRECEKLAEVCMCFTGDFLSPDEHIYTLEYYKDLARNIAEAGAHVIGIKDMAGLFKPGMAKPFMEAIRSVTDLPIHFHTHNTSGAALTSVINMAQYGCSIVDLAMASMADTTSQPSLNAFLTTMEGDPRDPCIPYRPLEVLDLHWSRIRATYFPFESGLKHGSVRVYDHQIPGGQYSNLLAQCKSLGIWDKWGSVLDMYRDVNRAFGNIVKVTPSSKCVGDMALFMINRNYKIEDLIEKGYDIDFPQSVVDLFKGALGWPHHGFPEEISKRILKNATVRFSKRPGAVLDPVNFVEAREQLELKHGGRKFTDEEMMTSLLYPKEFDDFVAFQAKNGGDLLMHLPTFPFMFGLRIGSTMIFSDPDAKDCPSYRVTLLRVGPVTLDNHRIVIFQANGRRIEHKVLTKGSGAGGKSEVDSSMVSANPDDRRHIPSPLPGVVEKILVKIGDKVKKGDVLMSVGAMKMEVQVVAPYDAVVSQIFVKVGSKVDNRTLLALLTERDSPGSKLK